MPEPEAASLAREWLCYAEDDLRAAAASLASRSAYTPRHVCFDAQQAAEKAIKACCVLDQIEFPFSHDLVEVAQLLRQPRVLTVGAFELEWLGQWATSTRYPGGAEPDWSDAGRAVEVAATVVADARASLEGT
jgi:HEPN domain-containing protein